MNPEHQPSASTTLRRHEASSLEAARLRAGELAGADGAIWPAVLFQQGARSMISTVMPITRVVQHALGEPPWRATRGSAKALDAAMYRPFETTRVGELLTYLQENPDSFLLLPIALSAVEEPVTFVAVSATPSGTALPQQGFVIFPPKPMRVTDGTHRLAALRRLIEGRKGRRLAELEQHSLVVQIICEPNLGQADQDFADVNQARPLPPALVMAYDRREPVNRLIADLKKQCPVFFGRVDSTVRSLSRTAKAAFAEVYLREM